MSINEDINLFESMIAQVNQLGEAPSSFAKYRFSSHFPAEFLPIRISYLDSMLANQGLSTDVRRLFLVEYCSHLLTRILPRMSDNFKSTLVE